MPANVFDPEGLAPTNRRPPRPQATFSDPEGLAPTGRSPLPVGVQLGAPLNADEDPTFRAFRSRLGSSTAAAREAIAKQQLALEQAHGRFLQDDELTRLRATEDLNLRQSRGEESIDQSLEARGALRSGDRIKDRGRLSEDVERERGRIMFDLERAKVRRGEDFLKAIDELEQRRSKLGSGNGARLSRAREEAEARQIQQQIRLGFLPNIRRR